MTGRVGAPDEAWTLTPEDHALAMSRHRRTRRGFVVLLAFFRSRGRFPRFESAVERRVMDAVGEQLDAPAPAGDGELLTARADAALTPLVWSHVNPYGRLDLDMNARMARA